MNRFFIIVRGFYVLNFCGSILSTARVIFRVAEIEETFPVFFILSRFICSNAFIVMFMVPLLASLVVLCIYRRLIKRLDEVTARFALDRLNNRMFDIQSSVNNGEVSEEESGQLIRKLEDEMNLLSLESKTALYHYRKLTAFTFLYAITAGISIFL